MKELSLMKGVPQTQISLIAKETETSTTMQRNASAQHLYVRTKDNRRNNMFKKMRHSERPVTTLDHHETQAFLVNDMHGGERKNSNEESTCNAQRDKMIMK